MKKLPILFFLCDGLSDRNIHELNHKTPLSAAKHPIIDFLSNLGIVGLLDALSPGYTCGSDTAHMSLLGADPLKYYKGRGILEAMGSYAPLIEDDLVFKSSFGYLETTQNTIVKRGLSTKTDFSEIEKLIDNLNTYLKNIEISVDVQKHSAIVQIQTSNIHKQISLSNKAEFIVKGKYKIKSLIHYSGGFRSIFIIRGLGKTHANTCIGLGSNDPCVENLPYLVSQKQQAIIRNILINENGCVDTKTEITTPCICEFISHLLLELINSEIHRTIDAKHTIFNDVVSDFIDPCYLTRSASYSFEVPSFEEIHGMKGAMICNTPVVLGVARMLGLDCYRSVEIFNKSVKDPLGIYGLVFYHLKKTDDFSHSGEWGNKLKEIEKVDNLMLTYLKSILATDKEQECVVVFTGDHTTPCKIKKHTHDPVPCFISKINYEKIKNIGKTETSDKRLLFSEFLYTGKTFGRIRMIDLLKLCGKIGCN